MFHKLIVLFTFHLITNANVQYIKQMIDSASTNDRQQNLIITQPEHKSLEIEKFEECIPNTTTRSTRLIS